MTLFPISGVYLNPWLAEEVSYCDIHNLLCVPVAILNTEQILICR